MKKVLVALLVCACVSPLSASSRSAGAPTITPKDDGWEVLFNGKDLTGWRQLNGQAKYVVEDGAIVGVTVEKTPNSFLATEKEYGDFILELEFDMTGNPTNSGVQVRSQSKPDYQGGRVHGYQVEIDPGERAWTAGLYDEARRGWLYPLSLNPKAQAAFKKAGWNRLRVECVGNVIKTFLNGVPAAYMIDDMTPQGFIALQVHSINKPEDAGKRTRWRNIRVKTRNLKLTPALADQYIVNLLPNHLSQDEQARGWRLLWDGKTTRGWRGAYKAAFPEQGWEIRDGELRVLESGGGESRNGGDIVTLEEFSAFDLSLDFKLTPGANSGIKYFVTEKEKNTGSAIGLEYQLLDDEKHPDAGQGRDGNRTLASLYDLIAAKKEKRHVRRPGEWNTARLVVRPDNRVEHWLNGIKVVEYVRGSDNFRALVAISKYKIWPNFGEAPKGRILLQDHGNAVAFRSIKVRT